jgi:hypothetical protein
MTQLITTCDPKSSAYPRYFNILLKLHKTLEQFDVAPEPDSTESAPESLPLTARLAGRSDAANAEAPQTVPEETHPADLTMSTISAPKSFSAIQNLKSKIQNSLSPESTKSTPPEDSDPIRENQWESVSKTSSLSSEARILKFIDQYRNHFKTDPPEHVFRHLEQARIGLAQPVEDLTRQAS